MSGVWRTRWSRRVAVGFGLVLVVAAILKAASPTAAASSLAWTGASATLRYGGVVALGGVEALIGASLVLGAWPLVAHAAGTVLAAVLLAGHLLLVDAGAACGCIGDVAVPAWVLRAVLVGGGAACWLVARCDAGPPIRTWHAGLRAIAVAVVTAAASIPAIASAASDGSAALELVRTLDARPDDPGALVVVGSTSCSDCMTTLERLRAAHPDLVMWLLTRGRDSEQQDLPPRILRRAIADDLWWRLIEGSPPAVFRLRGGRAVRW